MDPIPEQKGVIGRLIRFCLTSKLVVLLVLLFVILWGLRNSPFEYDVPGLPRDPVPVDAIPDIGEKQQIVFVDWMGRSPQDVEDQVTYPLTSALLGVPGVKDVRSVSMFGFSSIYVIFEDKADYYWARTRVLEKLSSLPEGTLPKGVEPSLGPDATAIGQIFWYTLEGRSSDGKPTGGWDLEELRTIQDWTVRYHIASTPGVAEVASAGGYVREYQIDVNPDAMRQYGVMLDDVSRAVAASNLEVGAASIEMNGVEYLIRGVGFLKGVSDIEESVVTTNNGVPILVKNVAHVSLGPAIRTGAIDKGGAEAAGGVVVARYGSNPLQVIKDVKKKIEEVNRTLPEKAVVDYAKTAKDEVEQFGRTHGFDAFTGSALNQEAWLTHLRSTPKSEWPAWTDISKVAIVPFYDRTGLIRETLGTLRDAIRQETVITVIVVIVMAMNLGSSILISSMMPLAVLLCFIAMRYFGVDANIVALSGIAIAIGTIVDMGIVISDNIMRHLHEAPASLPRLEVVHRAASEVGSAVLTAVATTVVGFLPVFFMTGAEGKLFKPLAYTKTFALVASIVIALTIIPPAAQMFFCSRFKNRGIRRAFFALLGAAGIAVAVFSQWWAGAIVFGIAAYHLLKDALPSWGSRALLYTVNIAVVIAVTVILAEDWSPLGPQLGRVKNLVFVAVIVAALMSMYLVMRFFYRGILGWCLRHKLLFLSIPAAITVFGVLAWIGWDGAWNGLVKAAGGRDIAGKTLRESKIWAKAEVVFPGFGKEFMPPLDEGAFLYMPTTMAHASIGEALDILSIQNKGISSIPEVESVVGKIGRVESALDPAPTSMIETVINYKPEYAVDEFGKRLRFRYDSAAGQFARDAAGNPIEDPNGVPMRLWRDQIKSPDDIWKQILAVTKVPGATSSPKLQPIITRIIMLQTGMRAPMGIKVYGASLQEIEKAGVQIEALLKEVPSVEPSTVIADRIIGKPYLEIRPDRKALERYDVKVGDFQMILETALGGERVTTTVEGRQRFPVRIRYQRELRDSIEELSSVLVPTMSGGPQIPLGELATVEYVRGPEMIKGERGFLVGYVLFDKKPDRAEVDVVEECKALLDAKARSGEFVLPAGVTYAFAGNYENQIRAASTLAVILPLALFVIFLLIYFQFRSVITTSLVFTGIFVAGAGGFLMVWFYGQGWFLDFEVFGRNLRDIFHMHTVNLSVAVWVGFLALFGIATDDGVIMGTYLDQVFRSRRAASIPEIRRLVIVAGERRIRPCLMTTATTVLALLPVLTSTGRGSDILIPMAIPSFGGMTIEILTMLVVPVLYCAIKETKFRFTRNA